jgi:hypothetical protein
MWLSMWAIPPPLYMDITSSHPPLLHLGLHFWTPFSSYLECSHTLEVLLGDLFLQRCWWRKCCIRGIISIRICMHMLCVFDIVVLDERGMGVAIKLSTCISKLNSFSWKRNWFGHVWVWKIQRVGCPLFIWNFGKIWTKVPPPVPKNEEICPKGQKWP